MTDWKALCQELADELHSYKLAHPQHDDVLVERARAYLDQPESIEDRIVKADLAIEESMNRVRAIAATYATSLISNGLDQLDQPEPPAPVDAANRVTHYLEQRQLVRGLDQDVINALHAGTDEPRQATLTVTDLKILVCAVLSRWGSQTSTVAHSSSK